MNGWIAAYARKGIPIALACTVALFSGGTVVLAEHQPTEAQILEKLKARETRAAHDPADERERREERRLIDALLIKNPRSITLDERRMVAEKILRQKPSLDLEVMFEYDSATIGPKARATLETLGRTLIRPELNGAIFVIAGHTDAAGSDSHNQSLSERRAEAVKVFLGQQFKLSPNQLLAIGFGRSQLKNAADPSAAENRRVQIVNTEQQATAGAKPFVGAPITQQHEASEATAVDGPAIALPDDLKVLDQRFIELYQAGKFSEAILPARRALEIREKTLGPDDPDVATSLDNLGQLYYRQSRYADAEPLYTRALVIREKALGADHPDVGQSLASLAVLYTDQSRYADAEPLHKRALAILEKAVGPDHPDVAKVLNNLASLYADQGRYGDAEPLYRRALAIDEKAPGRDHLDVATSLNGLALLYTNQSRYADAEPLYKRALEILEKALGPDHPDVAAALNGLASLYQAQGRYFYKEQGRDADAESLYKRALAILEKAPGPVRPDLATSLNGLALLYTNQGRYADAEPLYRRALEISEKAFDYPNAAGSLNNLADLYLAQRRYADAEPLYKRALEISGKAFGPDHPSVATSLSTLGLIYTLQRRPADAEPLYKRAAAILEKALGPDHPNVATSLSSLAAIYSVQGRDADALSMVQTMIAHGRAEPSLALPILYAAEITHLAPAARVQDDAFNVVQRASQSAAAAAVNKLGARLAAGSGQLASLVRSDQDLAAEVETLDKAILAAVSKETAKRDAVAEQRIRDRLAETARARAALQGVLAAEFPDYAALSNPQPLSVKEIQALLSDNEALLLFSNDEERQYVFAVTRTSTTWIQQYLGMAELSEEVAAFRRGLDVDALRQSAQGGKPVLFDLRLANELYGELIKPVERLVKDKEHLLIVPSGPLTALPFHLLVTEKPAIAIPDLKDIGSYRDAAWLIKRHTVSVLPALASLKALRRVASREPGAKPLVGFGDPVFDPAERAKALAERRPRQTRIPVTRSYGDFWKGPAADRAKLARYLRSLPDTADELNAVAAKLGAATNDIHLGGDASETVVKRTALADYRVVYFATHGLVAGDVEGLAEPSLALTLPKQPTEFDDGLLTASEVAQLKLNADWVVLSACNTAAGEKPGAEALSGLARAFFYAGARALLVSHWSVDSEAATRLTTSTFAIMAADPKLGRAEALRNAMLAYMNDKGSPLNAYPAFWGPFSIIGEGAAR
jgi:CHAT domain-containing protein/tetratricopeptide (TPR) repeat protein